MQIYCWLTLTKLLDIELLPTFDFDLAVKNFNATQHFVINLAHAALNTPYLVLSCTSMQSEVISSYVR